MPEEKCYVDGACALYIFCIFLPIFLMGPNLTKVCRTDYDLIIIVPDS